MAIEHQAVGSARRSTIGSLPPYLYFVGSAVFHTLGPAFAVLLFARVDVLGVAWLRIAAAALVLGAWCRPWRLARQLNRRQLTLLVAMGFALAVMNVAFYLAISRIPLATVSAIECLGPVVLAAWGARSLRNFGAVGAAAMGAVLLTGVRFVNEPVGMLLAFANAALFAVYITLGHRIVRDKVGRPIERLAIAMVFAWVIVTPIAVVAAVPALHDVRLLAAGVGVGICSSVIPYICDQLAMARLSRSTFALLLFLIPATAAVIGALVLRQFPSPTELTGIALIAGALSLHRELGVGGDADSLPGSVAS